METKTISSDKEQMLERRAACMNRVHKYVNEVVPVLVALLENGFKLTNSYQLYQKDKDRLDNAKDTVCQPALSQGTQGRRGSSAYIRSDEYNITLEVSDNYPAKYHSHDSSSYSSDYYKKTIYLWNNRDKCPAQTVTPWEPLDHINYIDMINASNELIQVEAEISGLQDKAYKLRRLTGN